MACLPFPSFVNTVASSATSLVAVGRCRVASAPSSEDADAREFIDIVAKNREQAMVDGNADAAPDERKKLKKKYMKQGVAMASRYLRERLKLDVSIVDVDFVVDSRDVLETDGCLAACLLDAGCSKVVMDGTSCDALMAAKIPRERIVADFSEETATKPNIDKALEFAGTVSIQLATIAIETAEQLLMCIPQTSDKVVFQVGDIAGLELEDLLVFVAAASKLCKDGKGAIALVDPNATQLGLAFAACAKTDRDDGLYSTVVCTRSGEALGLVYSSKESIVAALECGRGVYYSRSRRSLWRKGDTSGHYQTLHRLDLDCDGDALRFTVTQRGDDTAAFCHLNTLTCWGEPTGLRHLERTLQERLLAAPEGSYTKRLFEDSELLRDKLVEEAQELSEATEPTDVAGELADVLYFAMVRAVKAGVGIDDAIAELDRRTRKVTRRKGDSKAFRIAAGDKILNKEK
mmetsp:Transcript_23707/g.66950  ORF Transcript_23707/g.66950 Transcript_23707/m.66950 type:complete len:461 (+) Transcript_23707:91-1473(+)